ncbi:hypothetical protein JAAARDRAFT_33108 [Jaapia argillacea MUCL 33604]|uniref:tRNA-splicing endonuclease subunit Sen34 n=1 Tax=Jaapia argillacea MUCL 33604 TaxID=933084 RepID=A0A067Q7R8_9AGAM|nr:hypothetical protein JAAARDRAFT_33108 [Jaapia argillacea MUCL 33604]
MAEPRIALHVSNQKAYVWDVDSIATLRSKHHICGLLTGTLPHLSQQNVFLGVPLVLMPEEVVFLMEREVAVIVDDPKAHPPPTKSELTQWTNERQSSIKAQLAQMEAKENKGSSAKGMTEAAVRKRIEREARRAAKAKQTVDATGEPAAEGIEVLLIPDPDPRPATPTPSISTTTIPYTVSVPTTSSSLPWYTPSTPHASYTTLKSAQDSGVWRYPSDKYERARCEVFKYLWEKGYFMGIGIKFGGDYLVYPGDPLRYHSHFVATVLESPKSVLRPMEVVAHGRLGTATKKAHLLCAWDEEKGEVECLSIEWAGFG